MSDQTSGGTSGASGVDSNDKLLAALSYPLPLVGIFILISDTMKTKPFMKFHAVQSIALGVVVWVLFSIFSTVTLGFGALCFPVPLVLVLYYAWKTYQGELVTIPMLTDFIKGQGWA